MTRQPVVRLGDVACEVSARAGAVNGLPVYSVTKHAGFVPSLEFFTKQVFSRDTSAYKLVRRDQFAYATIHLDEGSLGLLSAVDAALISPMYTVFEVDPQRVYPRYLFRALKAPQMITIYSRLGKGSVHRRKAISFERLADVRLRLPDLPEQRRIANMLDRADAIRRKRREAIALTEELLSSTFLEMFGDPVANPKGWHVKPLGELIERLDAGWSANGEARRRTADEYGVLKVSAVTSGVFRPEEHKAVPAESIDRELITPRAGDLLFSRANTRELVAATCLVEHDEPRLFLPDKLWRVVLRADLATAAYLRFLLAHDRFRAELTKTATGTSGSMLNVSMGKLCALQGPVPPLTLQQRFAKAVSKILYAKKRYEMAEQDAVNLFASLVGQAFSGGLQC